MFTRGRLAHPYTPDDTARPSPAAAAAAAVRTPGPLVTSAAPPLRLPPPVIPLDPSDPATWTVPVRYT